MYPIYHVSTYVKHMPMAQAAITRWPYPNTPIPPSFGVAVEWDALLGESESSKRVAVPLISPSRFSTCDRELPREQAVMLEVFLQALCDHFSSKTNSCSVTKIKLYLKKSPNQPPPLCRYDGTRVISKEKLIPGWAARGSCFVQLLIQARGVNTQLGSLHHHKTLFLVLDTSLCFWFLWTVIQNL